MWIFLLLSKRFEPGDNGTEEDKWEDLILQLLQFRFITEGKSTPSQKRTLNMKEDKFKINIYLMKGRTICGKSVHLLSGTLLTSFLFHTIIQ